MLWEDQQGEACLLVLMLAVRLSGPLRHFSEHHTGTWNRRSKRRNSVRASIMPRGTHAL